MTGNEPKEAVPITSDDFDRIRDEGTRLDSSADCILDFLVRNEDKAYTQSEIAAETGVARENVGLALDGLEERGSVERKSNYWRVSDHELAARAGTALTAETAREYDDEGFDVEEWAAYAVEKTDRHGENE